MQTSNPKIDGNTTSVQTLLSGIPVKNPTHYTVHGSIGLPSWDGLNYHLQGVAPVNGASSTVANGCFTGSSTQGYFAGFSQTSGQDPQVRSVTEPDAAYYHAAGIQMLGELLPVPLESGNDGTAKVACYDVSQLASPRFLYNITMLGQKASAVGITTYTDGDGVEQAILAVYEYDHRYMYFYRAVASSLETGANPWEYISTYEGDALQGDQYQCFAMVTQAQAGVADSVYLLGFREDEELHLFSVVTVEGDSYGQLAPVAKYTGWNGSDWRNGVGLQIPGTTSLRIFGTDKDPKGKSNDYTVGIYVWG